MDNEERLNVSRRRPVSRRRLIKRLPTNVLLLTCAWLLWWGVEPVQAQQPVPTDQIVVRVEVASQAEVNRLAAELDVWQVDHAGGTLTAWVTRAQLDSLLAHGFVATVDAELNRLATESARRIAAAESVAGIPGFACYRTVEETYADLAALAAAHPNLAAWIDIGDSWEKEQGLGGDDIFALQLTNRAVPGPKPKFVLMAAIHAREYTTAELATRFAERLVAGYGVDPDITWLLDYHELHVIPQANPDGRKRAETGLLWRKNVNDTETHFCPANVHGVDLNRNSSFRWNECEGSACSSGFPCDLTYRGPAPASEPETTVIQAYLTAQFPDRRGPADADAAPADTEGLFISLHSFSELVLFPWGWTGQPSPNFAALQTLGRKFGYFTGYQVCQAGSSGCLYQTDGTTDDWSYGTLGVASYTFELGTWFFESCTYFENSILDSNMDALLYAFKAARRPYQTPSGPEVVTLDAPAQVDAGTPLLLTVVADDSRSAANARSQAAETVQTIAAARYSVDAPSWISGTVTYAMNAPTVISATATLTATVDTTGWSGGRHTIFVEAQDSDGNWGVPTAVHVHVPRVYDVAVGGVTTQGGLAGERLSYSLAVTNTGIVTDSYAIFHSLPPDLAWDVTVAPDEIRELPPGESATISVTIEIPPTAQRGETVTIDVRVLSAGNLDVYAQTELSAHVADFTSWLPLIVTGLLPE